MIKLFCDHEYVLFQEVYLTHSDATDDYYVAVILKICKKCTKTKIVRSLKR